MNKCDVQVSEYNYNYIPVGPNRAGILMLLFTIKRFIDSAVYIALGEETHAVPCPSEADDILYL